MFRLSRIDLMGWGMLAVVVIVIGCYCDLDKELGLIERHLRNIEWPNTSRTEKNDSLY